MWSPPSSLQPELSPPNRRVPELNWLINLIPRCALTSVSWLHTASNGEWEWATWNEAVWGPGNEAGWGAGNEAGWGAGNEAGWEAGNEAGWRPGNETGWGPGNEVGWGPWNGLLGMRLVGGLGMRLQRIRLFGCTAVPLKLLTPFGTPSMISTINNEGSGYS